MSWKADKEGNWPAQQLDHAKRQFQESEWVLNILRTQTDAPIKPATNEEILLWNKQLNSNPN
jgi:hypothetical protein